MYLAPLAVDGSGMQRRAWWLYLAALVAGTPVYFAVSGTAQRVGYYVYGLSAVAAIVVGVSMHRPPQRRPWVGFAAGLLLFAAGDIAFDLYDAAGTTTPMPSVADGLYLLAYPALAWGMVLLVRHRMRGADLASVLDGVMVALGVGVLAWVYIMAPYAHDNTLSVAARVVPIAYPALDLLLVAVLVRLLLSRGMHNPSFRLLAASVAALVVADGFYAFASLHNTYTDGGLIDLGWLLSYALWGAAALHPSMARLTDPWSTASPRRNGPILAVLALAALASPAIIVIKDLRGTPADEALLGTTSAIMFGLVLARGALLNSSNRRLEQAATRQRTLTEAAVAFVAAPDAESMAHAAVEAGVALAGDVRSWSVFATMSPSGPKVLAAAGPAPWPVGSAISSMSPRWDEPGPRVDPSLIQGKFPHVAGREPLAECFVSPVLVGDTVRGTLVVGDIINGRDAFLPVLGLLSSEMGLALQSVEAAEERLQARNEREFRSLVQNSSDVVTLIEPDGLVRYQSPGVRAMLGRDADTLVGTHLGALIEPSDVPDVRAQLTKVLTGGLGASANFSCRVAHADGTWREVDTIMTNLVDDPDVDALVLNSRDVTIRRELERELNRQTFHDGLTGLANRALFVDRLGHALDRANRDSQPIAVLFLDLDDFKVVNDSLGHPAGDELLVRIAERLAAATRPGDTVARFGGDEFAVLLESGRMPDAAEQVARRVTDALEAPVTIGTHDISVRASIGIALRRSQGCGPDDLLRDADLAMYLAKHNGKGRFEMYQPDMHEHALHRLQTAADLRQAIERGELEAFYQPIVDIGSARAVGVEALVRWHHPTRGLVSPAEFIPVAESTGLIVALGRWMLTEACHQAQSWRRSGIADDHFYVSVNVSARQLQDPSLLGDVAAAIRTSGLPAHALVLEVTESLLIEDYDTSRSRLQALKDLGLRLAIDDFGTGFSSLSHLHNLPVDLIKIDKSFVDRITVDAEGAALVRSVIDMSTALGLKTIAEGVEHQEQLALLDELGCDNVQGYLFAKPMPAELATQRLSELNAAQAQLARSSPSEP